MNLSEERKEIQKGVSQEISKQKKGGVPVTCKANCSNCCHVKVSVFEEEVQNILSLGVYIDLDKLEKQNTDWPNSDHTCVFIKDGNCSIHDYKPLSCVSHIVNTPSDNCKEGSGKPINMVRSITSSNRLRELRKENKTVILHEELYKYLK